MSTSYFVNLCVWLFCVHSRVGDVGGGLARGGTGKMVDRGRGGLVDLVSLSRGIAYDSEGGRGLAWSRKGGENFSPATKQQHHGVNHTTQ